MGEGEGEAQKLSPGITQRCQSNSYETGTTMLGIDETSSAGRSSSASRTGRTGASGEAEENGKPGEAESATSGKFPKKDSTYRPFMDDVLGGASGEASAPAAGGGGDAINAYELQGRRAQKRGEMAERKQTLGEALDHQYETMGSGWEEDGWIVGKGSLAWKRQYKRRNAGDDWRQTHRTDVEDALVRNGRTMSDADIEEVVSEHRQRLDERGAFENWETDDIDDWETGLTSALKRERAEEQIHQFESPPVEGLPTPSRNLEERTFDNPDQIREKLDTWEEEQLEKLDRLATEAEVEGDSIYRERRERIQQATEAYEAITVGTPEGTKKAYPEKLEVEGKELRPRDAYIRHLEENPGDIMGAYERAEDRMRDENRAELINQLVSAGG